MGNDWEDKGSAEGIIGQAVGSVLGMHDRLVENTKTGETKTVYVNDNQTTGDAIAKGQFKK